MIYRKFKRVRQRQYIKNSNINKKLFVCCDLQEFICFYLQVDFNITIIQVYAPKSGYDDNKVE